MTGAASKYALAIPDGSPRRSILVSSHHPVGRPDISAYTPCASRPSSSTSTTPTKPTRRSRATCAASGRATSSGRRALARATEISEYSCELAATRRRALFGDQVRADAAREERPFRPAEKHRQDRQECGQRRGQRDPCMTAERTPLHHDEHAEHPGSEGDRREHEDDGPVERMGSAAVCATARAAPRPSRPRTKPPARATAHRSAPLPGSRRSLCSVNGIPRDAYAPCLQRWAARPIPRPLGGAVASRALGDANRGARSWPYAAVSDHARPAASTPRAAGLVVSAGTVSGVVAKVLLASPRGYCAGVERAVETVDRALELYGARRCTSASRSCTTSTSSASSRHAARLRRRRGGRSRRKRPWCCRRTASRRRCTRTLRPGDSRRSTPRARSSPRCTCRRGATPPRATPSC